MWVCAHANMCASSFVSTLKGFSRK
uniref:Uncharacterized protein n=1 Tax=Rhizophora mucronata TaxID=61149 RepID=A0A2P2NEC2_RHIMU